MCLDIVSGDAERETILVVGLGMVALSFIEKIKEYDTDQVYQIKVFSEEPHGKSLESVEIINSSFASRSGVQQGRPHTILFTPLRRATVHAASLLV